MLEQAEALATWQFAEDPAALHAGAILPARRLPDHRKAYLTLEGPVSGDRGSVRQVHAGTCHLLHAESTRWLARLEAPTCQGLFELRQEPGGQCREGADWRISRVE